MIKINKNKFSGKEMPASLVFMVEVIFGIMGSQFTAVRDTSCTVERYNCRQFFLKALLKFPLQNLRLEFNSTLILKISRKILKPY